MSTYKTFFALVTMLVSLICQAQAALVISFGAPQTFSTNSGIQPLTVFVNSTESGGETEPAIGADFTLSGGAVFNSPSAGNYGASGFVGFGNINSVASSFDRDTNPGLENVGYLNINFANSAGNVPDAITPLATLLINTNGLATGTYSISATSGFFGLDSIPDAVGSFNITAVPEPSSMIAAMFGLSFISAGTRRLRRKRRGISLQS
jgi:hypothetical protein